jgi:hypothetical protein
MNLLEQNLKKCQELVPAAQWAAMAWVNECFSLNLQFVIPQDSGGYRTPEQQHSYWLKGRDKAGHIVDPKKIVTYQDGKTLISKHQKRLALDVAPRNCSFDDITQVAKKYGIAHPFEKGKFIDRPHYEFDQAVQAPSMQITPEARLKGLLRRIEHTNNEDLRQLLKEEVKRLQKRLAAKDTN